MKAFMFSTTMAIIGLSASHCFLFADIKSLNQQIDDLIIQNTAQYQLLGQQKTRIDNIGTVGYKAAECIVKGDMDGLTELAWGVK